MSFSPVFGISEQQISDHLALLDTVSTDDILDYRPYASSNFRALADRVLAGRTTTDQFSR